MQEQEPDSPLNDPINVEDDPIAVNTQTIDPSVRHTTDGKKIVYPPFIFLQ